MSGEMSGIFKPEAKTTAKIFGDADSYYQIPDYQRPYSWKDDQIEQLWNDLFSAMEEGDERYFLGAMILIQKEGYFEVVDGQQRLTTLTICFCVLRDLYRNKFIAVNEELANKVQDAIKSLVRGKHRLKLITQIHYQNKFQQEILNGINFPEIPLSVKEKEANKFMNAAVILKDKLEEIKRKSGIKKIISFADYLLNNVEMVTITCLKTDYAIRLFQVLNTRGMNLSPADLIKSHLYGNIDDDIEKKQFISTWFDIEATSENLDESLTDLLTYYEYFLLSQNPKKSLYEELFKIFKGKDSNKVVYDFKQFVDYYRNIYEMESKLINSF